MKALIIGGGIGGLAAAIALRRAGLAVRALEQAAALREAGAGLTLWSNAMRALDRLGLTAPLLAAGTVLERGEIRAASGRLLAATPLGDLGRRMGAPIVGIHRADLLTILAAAVDPADVRLNARFERFEQDGGGITAHFADGPPERGDLLIGADGIHSRARQLLVGDPQRYAGYVGWRGATPFSHADLSPGLSVWSYGRGGQFGLIPIGGGRVFWFGTANVPEGAIDRLGPARDELWSRFRNWHRPIPDLLQAIDPDAVLRTPIYDRAPVRRWGTGRATLLGDAAHATTPTLGHGACLAIESAAVLARCLGRKSSVESALRRYERERQERTGWIIRQSWDMGRVIQWENPAACWLRDLAIRWTPRRVHERTIVRIVNPACVAEV
jgi:2-polyprenyl-6-methoxyphenol hydroxylase-like FAD-dependent oxidoreductase